MMTEAESVVVTHEPRVANRHQKPAERHGMISLPEPPEGTNPADALISGSDL